LKADANPLSSLSAIRILFLEDSLPEAKPLIMKLQAAGLLFEPEIVNCSASFMEKVRSTSFDLIVAGYHLPDWTGLEAVRWLRSTGNQVPFILASGAVGEELAVDCMREGATDYVLKDKLDRLPLAVFRAMEDRRILNDRNRTELELRHSEERYRLIINRAPLGIYRADHDGRILMANSAFIAMLGFTSESEVLALHLKGIQVDALESQTVSLMKPPSLEIQESQEKWKRKDGKAIMVRITSRSLPDPASGATVTEGFVEDTTDHHLLQQQFLQAQKMEAVGQLAGGIAHDFNNLLMVISSSAHLLNETQNDGEKQEKYTRLILNASKKAAALTGQLLAFSRRQVLDPLPLLLNSLIGDMAEMLPRVLQENIKLDLDLQSNLGSVMADTGQVEQIIMNLAVNARDAMPDGGRLIISTANVELDCEYGTHHGATIPPGDYVMLSVTDTGTGMTPATQKRLFEPFFTTKEKGVGTGLGLATVYGIVKQSGGHVWAYSEIGHGTTFKIYLPRVDAHVKEITPVPVIEAMTGSETILLVEDEAFVRSICRDYLQSKGYTVLEADGGANAIEICKSYKGPIHVLVTDVIMPGLNGPDIARAFLDIRPDARIIFMSGYPDRILEGSPLGPHTIFLQKPFNLASLTTKVRSVLRSA